MRKSFLLAVVLGLAAVLIPLSAMRSESPQAETTVSAPETSAEAPPETDASPTATEVVTAVPQPPEATVAVLRDGILTELALEDAVTAIVAAEMPALFPHEALKAQAVAARTYLAYRAAHPVTAHAEAVICDDPAHCCALADLDTLAAGWGEQGGDYAARILRAVAETKGEILTWEGEPIMAVFHAMSARKTNSAADVWGAEVAYLVSVDAPAEEAELDGYADSAIFSAEEFRTCFLTAYPEARLPLGQLNWFTEADYAASGLLRSVCVGGVRVSGHTLRTLCGLRSAAIKISQGTGRIRMDTVGYGHGVGMSQHGAKVLALRGLSHTAILAYYYPQTVIAAY